MHGTPARMAAVRTRCPLLRHGCKLRCAATISKISTDNPATLMVRQARTCPPHSGGTGIPTVTAHLRPRAHISSRCQRNTTIKKACCYRPQNERHCAHGTVMRSDPTADCQLHARKEKRLATGHTKPFASPRTSQSPKQHQMRSAAPVTAIDKYQKPCMQKPSPS